MASSTQPSFDEDDLLDRSPALARLRRKRLAPSRWRDLVKAAGSARPPNEPEPWECCGSSCKPCVLELYRVRPLSLVLLALPLSCAELTPARRSLVTQEERKVWQEVHPDGVSDDNDDEGEPGSAKGKGRANGAASHEEEELEPAVQPALKTLPAQPKAASPAIEIELEAMTLVDTVTSKLQTSRLVEAAG